MNHEYAQRKKRVHFTPDRDIMLLKLVIQHNPFSFGTERWKAVSQKLIQNDLFVDGRAVKNRCNHLLYLFNQQLLASINKSGTEESYKERASLISKVLALQGNEQQIVTMLGPDGVTEICQLNSPSAHSESSYVSNISSVIIDTPKVTKIHENIVADDEREIETNQLQATIDERRTHYATRKNKDDIIRKRLEVDLEIKQQDMYLKKIQVEMELEIKRQQASEEMDIKRRRFEEEMELKREEMHIKKISTEAEIARKGRELDLEEKRLNIENAKLAQANTLQQHLLDHQKLMMEFVLKYQK